MRKITVLRRIEYVEEWEVYIHVWNTKPAIYLHSMVLHQAFSITTNLKKVYVILLKFEIFLEDTNQLYLLSFTKQAFHISYSKYMYQAIS